MKSRSAVARVERAIRAHLRDAADARQERRYAEVLEALRCRAVLAHARRERSHPGHEMLDAGCGVVVI